MTRPIPVNRLFSEEPAPRRAIASTYRLRKDIAGSTGLPKFPRAAKLKRARKWRGLRRNWDCRERVAAGDSRAEHALAVGDVVAAAVGCRPRS